jgi:hypothetical protein
MSDISSSQPPFPPEQIGAFLRLCAGEWMSLRSKFSLGAVMPDDDLDAEDRDDWHSSERGELVVAFLEPEAAGGAGGLRVGPKDGVSQELQFSADGCFLSGNQAGNWFTKPNLRLRSTVATGADGIPGQASFSSEIRRVSRPAMPAS